MLQHNKTKALLKSFARQPTSSLIIEGGRYSGIENSIDWLVKALLGNSQKNNVLRLRSDTATLGIESIRELKSWLMTRVGGYSIGRVAIVEQSEKMTKEAQNALLKILEEPSDNTVIILSTQNRFKLLSTIHSRCQYISVLPITKEMALDYAKKVGKTDIESAYLLSAGEAELFTSLIHGEKTEMVEVVERAKHFLGCSVFERLTQQKVHAAHLENITLLLEGLHRVCEGALHTSNHRSVVRWKSLLTEVKKCQEQLATHTPSKLVYLNLCVNL